jgi:hypothetical protein
MSLQVRVACPVCESPDPHPFLSVDERDYWRCGRCIATFLDPAQLPSQAFEYEQYALHRNDPGDPGYRKFLARLAEPLLARLPAKQQGLDYGCGPGSALAALLTEAGHEVALYDPLFRPDQTVLERRYAFITCTEVIEHFHRPAAEFARLHRLLLPGAWLGVMTRLQTDDRRFAQWHYRREPTHVVFYRAETLEFIARRFGWMSEILAPDAALFRRHA